MLSFSLYRLFETHSTFVKSCRTAARAGSGRFFCIRSLFKSLEQFWLFRLYDFTTGFATE